MVNDERYIRPDLHDTTVAKDSSLWRIELFHKSTLLAYYWLANVAIRPEESCGSTVYVRMIHRKDSRTA